MPDPLLRHVHGAWEKTRLPGQALTSGKVGREQDLEERAERPALFALSSACFSTLFSALLSQRVFLDVFSECLLTSTEYNTEK